MNGVNYILNHVADLRFYYKCNGPPLRHLKDLYMFIHISGSLLCEQEVQDQEAERTVRRHNHSIQKIWVTF